MRRGWAFVGAVVTSVGMVMCSSFGSYSAEPEGDASAEATADASPGTDVGSGAETAPADAGSDVDPSVPACVQITPTICIDATEVTNKQYAAYFESTKPRDQPLRCANATLKLPASSTNGVPDQAVVNVTWCDAYAYCSWAGKHLCRKVGGVPIPENEVSTEASSTWVHACKVTLGASGPPECNIGTDASAPRASVIGKCGTGGVADMIGNVWEWVDSCSDTGCFFMGGGYESSTSSCTATTVAPFGFDGHDVGFRCCGAP